MNTQLSSHPRRNPFARLHVHLTRMIARARKSDDPADWERIEQLARFLYNAKRLPCAAGPCPFAGKGA